MRRMDKGKELAFPAQRKTASSHSKPPKTRKNKRSPTLEDYAIFKEDEEPRAPEDPTITGLKRTIKNLRADLWEHKNLVNDNQVRMASLEHLLNVTNFSLRRSLRKIARAAQVEFALH
jgi:hypothetical protein